MVKSVGTRKCSSLLILIYYCEKTIGLCPIVLDNEGFFKTSHFGVFYSILLCLIYVFFFCRAIVDRAETYFPMETVLSVITNGLVVSLQFAMIIVSWIIFAFRQKKLISIMQNFEKTGQIARKLGIHDDSWESMRTLFIRLIFINAFYCILFIFESVLCTCFPNFDWTIWVPHNFPHIVIHNVLVLFMTALQILKRRFHQLNVQLRNLPLISFQRRNNLQRISRSR